MESDTLEEIIEKSQLSNAPSDESAFHVANGITSVNKASSITNSDFYDIDNENLEFILNQEYEFNSNSKESKDCDDIFLIDDIADDTTSEIIPLNPDLSNFYKSEPNESNSHSNASSSGNPTETISEIIKDLIEKVDQTSAVTQAKPSHGNVSRITIQKITNIEPTTTTLPKLDTASTYESIIKDLKKSQNDKKSIELVPSLDPVKRSKPNILKKNRHSLPSNTKLKSMHISEILKLYGGPGPESDVKQESAQSEPSPIEASKIRIRQKVNIVLVKKTHVELVREYLDSNNNLIRQETLEEKNLKEVVESVNKEKVLPNKSAILPNIDELSSSSSLNLNQLGTIKNKKKESAQKSYKLALSNRYRNQSPETPKQAKKRPVRAKHKLSQKPEFKSPQKVHNFSFSNIRFNLTPQERKKDLLELKSGIESEKETSSPSKESLVEETLVNRKIGHFLVEFGNEMHQMDVNDGHGKMKDCYVPINRLPESDYEYFNEKYKNDQKKPKSKFSIGDKVFVCCLENNLFLPAVVTDIQSKRKSQSSSFFNMSSSDIYYSYGCCLAFKNDQFKLTDQVIYENENSIIKHDWIKPQDSILVHSFRDSRYTNSTLINLTPTVNKETRISDFTVKQFRSRYSKAPTMVKRALVFLAEGAEEMETVITVDTLRRAGVDVTLAGLAGDQQVLCSRNVKITPDLALESVKCDTFDAVIVPGGLKGAEACALSPLVGDILRKHYENSKLVAAICAGPTALFAHRLAFGRSITSYPSFKEKLGANYVYREDRVVQDGNLVTSQGPGTSFEFALKIVEYLEGEEKAKSLIEPMRLKS